MEGNGGIFEKWSHLKESKMNVKTEAMAGVAMFMTMAYVPVINPSVLGAAGMDSSSVFTVTALAALVTTLLMAVFSSHLSVLIPGMELNAYFAYIVTLQVGYTWEMALAAVFAEGFIFIVLSPTDAREAIFNSILMSLKCVASVGIGLFIISIGSQNAKIIVGGATLVSAYSLKDAPDGGTLDPVGITMLLTLIGILIIAILVVENAKGSTPWGILATWVLSMICQTIGLYAPNSELGMFSVLSDSSNGFGIKSMVPTSTHLDFLRILSSDFLVVVFALLFVDLLDILGTPIGVVSKADMLDKGGKLPKIKDVLTSDTIGTSVSAVLGTPTITALVESATGVFEGGKTGLTAVTAAALFGLPLFLLPTFLATPSFTTAPAPVVAGFLMLIFITKIDSVNYTEAVLVYIYIIAMPFIHGISEGIAMDVTSHVMINLVTGKFKEKKISTLTYVLAVSSVLEHILI